MIIERNIDRFHSKIKNKNNNNANEKWLQSDWYETAPVVKCISQKGFILLLLLFCYSFLIGWSLTDQNEFTNKVEYKEKEEEEEKKIQTKMEQSQQTPSMR